MIANDLPLPKKWPHHVRLAVLHVFSLAFSALTHARGWAVNSPLERVRLKARLEQATNEITLLSEEIRIKDARMESIPPHHRPHYSPTERMSILELRAARGWSAAQTARTFLLEPETIASWTRRIDEDDPHPLVQLPTPVNKFPEFVAYLVHRLKILCPTMGKKRTAQVLSRAGLKLGATTIGRMLKSPLKKSPPPDAGGASSGTPGSSPHRTVTARYPGHVWHVDLTAVSTWSGFWVPWLPFALPQVWPFCWWVGVILDHFTRSVVGFRIFHTPPSSKEVCRFLQVTIRKTGRKPKYIISDKGTQFWCEHFKNWCRRHRISPRFGAVGRYGSIALIERFFRSLKTECTRRILVPLRDRDFRHELDLYVTWYNHHRPNQALDGFVPHQLAASLSVPENTDLRPPGVANSDIPTLNLSITFLEGRRHLPIFELRKAA